MTEADPQRYNLVFSGQLLPDTDPLRARRTLAQFFGLKDPAAVDGFFSGKAVPLRRNLPHPEALRLYRQLRSVGLICDIPPVRAEDPKPGTLDAPAAPAPARAAQSAPPETPVGTAPNIFALRPAFLDRSPAEEREHHQTRGMIAGALAAVLCLIVATLILRFPPAPVAAEAPGPIAVTELKNGGLAILLPEALLLHARSGLPEQRVEAAQLGLEALDAPLHETTRGDLLLRGRGAQGVRVLRCRIDTLTCVPFGSDFDPGPDFAFAESYLGDVAFLYTSKGRLLRVGAGGEIEAQTTAPIPLSRPSLLYRDGLLLLPQPDAPFMGVYRPDADRFGVQLDALLLTPARADAGLPTGLLQVAAVGEDFYVLLSTDSGQRAVFHFDATWGSGEPVELAGPPSARAFLEPWKDRLLLGDPTQSVMQRIAPGGRVETPFTSTMLEDAREEWRRQTRQGVLLQRLGIVLPLVIAAAAAGVAALHLLALAALAQIPPVRTGLLDPMPAAIRWLPEGQDRKRAAARIAYLALAAALAAGLLAAGTGEARGALCLVPAALAALRAHGQLRRGCGGYLGLRPQEVIAIDHDGRYFRGRPAALRQGLGFLLSAGVALPLNSAGIRNIDTRAADAIAAPALGPAAVLGQLWRLGHPWMHAALSIGLGWLVSLGAWLFFA